MTEITLFNINYWQEGVSSFLYLLFIVTDQWPAKSMYIFNWYHLATNSKDRTAIICGGRSGVYWIDAGFNWCFRVWRNSPCVREANYRTYGCRFLQLLSYFSANENKIHKNLKNTANAGDKHCRIRIVLSQVVFKVLCNADLVRGVSRMLRMIRVFRIVSCIPVRWTYHIQPIIS